MNSKSKRKLSKINSGYMMSNRLVSDSDFLYGLYFFSFPGEIIIIIKTHVCLYIFYYNHSTLQLFRAQLS